MRDLIIRPRDPLIFRDARPFSADPGARAESLAWPLPGTFAGAVRSLYGNAQPNFDWNDAAKRAEAMTFATQGPFLIARTSSGGPWTVYLPAPRDAVPYTDADIEPPAKRLMVLRPRKPDDGAGVSQPAGAELWPMDVNQDVKPDGGLAFWSLPDVVAWLGCADEPDWIKVRGETGRPASSLPAVTRETRVHVKIQPGAGTAAEGMLFATIALAFRDAPGWSADHATGEMRLAPETALLGRYVSTKTADWTPPSRTMAFGGERRLAALDPGAAAPDLSPPPALIRQLKGKTRLRLLLVTPALFADGWRPGWLADQAKAPLPGVVFTLRGAAIDRRIPVSGWDMAAKQERATRYAVPAGGVYFFELNRPLDEAQIKSLWLRSIADGADDQRDGYGVVLPGLW